MEKKITYAIPFLVFMFIMLLTGNQQAFAGLEDCQKCHGTVISDFAVAPPAPAETCKACHQGFLINEDHPYPSWTAVYVPNAGYFKNSGSVATGVPAIHSYHSGKNTPANSGWCRNCHVAADCESCHKAVTHRTHGSVPVDSLKKYTVSTGTGYSLKPISCSTETCHSFYSTGVAIKRTDGQQLCINCHSTDKTGHTPERLEPFHNSANQTLRLGITENVVLCEGCHTGNLAVEHKLVAQELSQPEDTECGYCHMTSAKLPVQDAVHVIKTVNSGLTDITMKNENRSCSACHFNVAVLPERPAEHLTYHKAVLSDNLDISAGAHSDCNTCHARTNLLAKIEDLARLPISERKYDCFNCHNQDTGLAPEHTARLDGEYMGLLDVHPGCATCHTPGTNAAAKVETIALQVNNGSDYSCTECHYGASLDAGHTGEIDSNCTKVCHKPVLTEEHLDNSITQAGNADNPLNCVTCHKSQSEAVKTAIVTGNTNCFACHELAHNFNMVQMVPADIPLYPGYEWSLPQPADIWSGEEWMPTGYEGGKLLISNRLMVSRETVWNYYREQMAANGWTLPALELNADSFTAQFKKDRRNATVFFYGGENHLDSPVLPQGYRLEILYK